MDASLLHQAAAQAKTGWLEQALIDLLPQVWDLNAGSPEWQKTAANWAAQFDHLFEQKRLSSPGQQKNRRTDIANALRTIDPNHPLIPFVLLPAEVYVQLNNEQASRLNARENKFFSTKQANELVKRATHLLKSDKPDEVAAGLAVLVGRRISEILLSRFELKTSYSLLFSEAVKRRGEGDLEFEIPTLAPAEQVLKGIKQLKQVWNIEDLSSLSLSENHLKRRINARYSGVPHACRQHFADLVPGREAETDDGERLYTHLFRAVYAEIATYYYKPEWVPDHRFKAEIQGHFKFTQDGQKIPNYSARQNYDDYLIRYRISGQPGVKLGTPGVQILEVFQTENRAEAPERLTLNRQLEKRTINALIYRTVEQLLFSKQWAEAATGLILVTGRTIKMLMEKKLQEKSFFLIEVDELDVPTLTAAHQVITAWKKWKLLEPLPQSQAVTTVREICDRTFGDLIPVQTEQELRGIYSAIALHWFCPPAVKDKAFLKIIGVATTAGFETVNRERGIKLHQYNVEIQKAFQAHEGNQMTDEATGMTEMDASQLSQKTSSYSEPKPNVRHRRKSLSVDLNLLRTVTTAFGIEIRGQSGTGNLSYEAALAQVLKQLAENSLEQPIPQPPQDEGTLSALKDQARTLAWLTGRIETLEQQVETLQQERDEALSNATQAENRSTLEQLQKENIQLRQERDEANNKLQMFRQLLVDAPTHQEEQPIQDTSSRQIETPTAINPSKQLKPSKKQIPEEDALHHIRQAVHAIMAFNDQDGRAFKDMWYISFPAVQTLLRENGLSANQKHVAAVFKEMENELEQHHDKHAIGSRHNRKHPQLKLIAHKVQINQE